MDNNNNNKVNHQWKEPIKARGRDVDFFGRIKKDYASEAEKVINGLQANLPTISQIRNILSLVNDVSEKIVFVDAKEELPEEIVNSILYIRVKIAYIYGKGDEKVKNFINKSELIELLLCIGNKKSNFTIFAKYVEALVAYHKFYGGKDN